MKLFRLLYIYLLGKGSDRVDLYYGLGKKAYDAGYPRVSRIFFSALERSYGVYISPTAKLGHRVRFKHPTGIVIGEGVVVGDDVTIYQQVTLGGARVGDSLLKQYPQVGDGTVIFAGAKVLGNIRIGKHCVIGANAVVLTDVPDHHTAVGAPAKNVPR